MPDPACRENLVYLRRHCTPGAELAAAAGLDPGELEALDRAGVAPQPTYLAGDDWVASAIGRCGTVTAEPTATYYGPAVAPWLRRAAALARAGAADLRVAMLDWLASDLAGALGAAGDDAAAFGWRHVMPNGRPDRRLVRDEVEGYWTGWMRGGWAVCLRRFDGHHLMTKEIERQRLASLTGEWTCAALSAQAALAAVDAMRRLDSVLMPFAPCERPSGTPGMYLDRTAAQYRLPWPDRARHGRA